mgnify:FL=1|jgi:glutamate racemase
MDKNNKPPKILVFDSGVGGLTIFRALLEQTPDLEVVFASDNAGFPYGTRTEYSLLKRVHRVVERLISKFSPDLVVIACNSASTVALPSLREKFDIPFVGVVPAIKPAAALSKTAHIGILATPATVSRDYTHQLVEDFAGETKVSMLGSSELVQMAEEKLRGVEPDAESIMAILQPFIAEVTMDTLVMACTHFPLIQEDLELHLPQVTNWVESGAAIARRVRTLIPEDTSDTCLPPVHEAWLTATDPKIDELQEYLKGTANLSLQIYSVDSND